MNPCNLGPLIVAIRGTGGVRFLYQHQSCRSDPLAKCPPWPKPSASHVAKGNKDERWWHIPKVRIAGTQASVWREAQRHLQLRYRPLGSVRHIGVNLSRKPEAYSRGADFAGQKEFDQACQGDWTPLGVSVFDRRGNVPFEQDGDATIFPR